MSKSATTVTDQTSPLIDIDDPESEIDPIDRRVIGGSLINICDEMGHKLTRMSYSSIIRESEDFGCALLDEQGRQLCETDSTPLQMGPIPAYVQGVIDLFEEQNKTFEEGDVIIHNDPYYGASHAPDFAIIVPVFHEGDLTAFSVTTAHHLEIGGDKPGTCIIETVDSYSESIRLDALKIVEAGDRNETAWQMIADNIRTPDMVMGDIEAQISAARVGATRLTELFDEHGHEIVKVAGQALMNYSERMLRSEIATLPDGTYSAEGYIDGYLDSDNPDEKDIFLAVDLEVDGDDISVDLSRCDDQLDNKPINMPFEGAVIPAVLLVIRSTLLDTEQFEMVPQNDGITRPVSVHAPKGSIANPRFPAPTIARFTPGTHRRPHPEGAHEGRSREDLRGHREPESLDQQRRHRRRVLGVHGHLLGELRRPPDQRRDGRRRHPLRQHPEQSDRRHREPLPAPGQPLRARENEEGAGEYRGGYGPIRELQYQSDGRMSIEGDGSKYPPWGFEGGEDGSPGALLVEDEIDESTPRSKMSNKPIEDGQRITLIGPCGGGWGDPLDRDPEQVRADILDDLVSRECVRDIYGVVLTDDLDVDKEETEKLRKKRR